MRFADKVFFAVCCMLILCVTISSVLGADEVTEQLPTVGKLTLSRGDTSIEYINNIYTKETTGTLINAISLNGNTVSVDTKTYPELDQPAYIIFNNQCLTDPIMLHNGWWSRDVKPIEIAPCIWQVRLPYFSTWQIIDSAFSQGTHINTTVYGGNLTLLGDALLLLTGQSAFNDSSTQQWNVRKYGTATYNTTGGKQGTGGFKFGGTTGKLNVTDSDAFSFNYTKPYTVSLWVKIPRTVPGGTLIYRRVSYGWGISISSSGAVDFFTSSALNFNCVSTISINDTIWHHIVGRFNNSAYTYAKNLYIDGTLNKRCLGGGSLISGTTLMIGATSSNTAFLTGELDDIKIYNRTLTTAEITALYSSTNPTYRYVTNGSYVSQIFNATNYNPNMQTNKWQTTVVGNATGINTMKGRASSCATLSSQPWITGSLVGTTYTFNQNGLCFQYKMFISGNKETSPNFKNVTVTSNATYLPTASNLAISAGVINKSTPAINGSAKFNFNDTTSGGALFRWYVNNALVKQVNFTGLSNGITFNSSVINSYYSSGQTVNFTIIPYINDNYGATVRSTSKVIANSGFNITTWIPVQLGNLTVTQPSVKAFSVSLYDIDNDVVCRWMVNGIATGFNGTGYSFLSADQNVGTNSVNTTCTDGSYSKGIEWEITVLEQDLSTVAMIGICFMAVVFLAFAFLLDAVHFMLKYLSIIFCFITLMLIPAAIISGYASIQTKMHEITLWFFVLLILYFGVYFFFHWTKTAEVFLKLFKK